MILSRPLHDAMRGVGRNALDLPVAGLAALAALFVAFALPADLLSDLVGASGLPSLLPAAEPPLGLTARIAIGIVGALATFGLVIVLLRLLDRSGLDADKPARAPAPAAEDDALKLRRRDAHPDAPVRRPISAARDLGEPAPPVSPKEALPAPEPAAAEAPAPEPAPAPAPAPEPEPAETPSSLPDLMERLERGLARRAGRPAPAAPQAPPQVFPEPGDDRLQSAIDSLQRLAARQG